uniref:Uncharacterized protein n=1 Tax=Arundo donax TaxID=35708 RepID=A0A0A9CX15_ARUDO
MTATACNILLWEDALYIVK